MKHGLEEASATVRRCHIFGRGEAIWSIPISNEVSVTHDLAREQCTQMTCRFHGEPQKRAMWRWEGRPSRPTNSLGANPLRGFELFIDKGPNFWFMRRMKNSGKFKVDWKTFPMQRGCCA